MLLLADCLVNKWGALSLSSTVQCSLVYRENISNLHLTSGCCLEENLEVHHLCANIYNYRGRCTITFTKSM